jgi:hypothetical protein
MRDERARDLNDRGASLTYDLSPVGAAVSEMKDDGAGRSPHFVMNPRESPGNRRVRTLARSVLYHGVAASVALPPPWARTLLFFCLRGSRLARVRRMKIAELAAVAAFSWLLGACSEPRTPDSALSAGASSEGDAGELSCDERARAQVVCQSAFRQRCASQGNDCEAACERGDLPANTMKHPSTIGEEATQCRDNCRQVRDGCVSSATTRCPVPCP